MNNDLPRVQGIRYDTAQPVEITLERDQIAAIRPIQASGPLSYIAPAFFDLQINGCGGHGFSSENLSQSSIRAVVETCHRHGIAALCPTLITNSYEALHHGFSTLRQAVESDGSLARALPAFHLEGPYISVEDGPRGAHPRRHVRPPDLQEFQRLQEAAGGRIRLVTLSPEWDGALRFIEQLVHEKVVVAIGHTAAAPARIRDAIQAGARLSTHLGNGCHALLPRHQNYVWEQLAADELWASIICDGHHLPASMIRCILRVKTPARLILTCDASSLAGLPPGRYHEWEQELEILPEGKIVVCDSGFLAGSWAFTDTCIGNVMRFGGASLSEAIAMSTDRPRELLGLPVQRLEPGQPADLVLFDLDAAGAVQVRQRFVGGERVEANCDCPSLPALAS